MAYVPFGVLIEAAQMRHYHKKLLDADAIKDKVYILEVILECEA